MYLYVIRFWPAPSRTLCPWETLTSACSLPSSSVWENGRCVCPPTLYSPPKTVHVCSTPFLRSVSLLVKLIWLNPICFCKHYSVCGWCNLKINITKTVSKSIYLWPSHKNSSVVESHFTRSVVLQSDVMGSTVVLKVSLVKVIRSINSLFYPGVDRAGRRRS